MSVYKEPLCVPSSCVDIREQFVCVIHACVCAFIVFHGSVLTPKWCWGGHPEAGGVGGSSCMGNSCVRTRV